MKAQSATVTAQVVVRDKDGNVKYQGPLVMPVTGTKEAQDTQDTQEAQDVKESEHGSNP